MFSCIFDQVSGALGMITGAQNLFESAIIGVAKAIVGQVTGGIWKGNGATKFVEMVNTQFISLATTGQTNCQGTGNNLNLAQQIVQDGDNMANGMVNDLENLFSSIF
ncbi:MAG: hypothetical protein ABSE06_07040 [Anaerolineaceae bacterium]|jgi:hypothetical protein